MNENLMGKKFDNDKEEQRDRTLEYAVKTEFIEEYKDKIEKDKREAFENFSKRFIGGFDKKSKQFISEDIENNDPDINSWLNDYKEYYDSHNYRIKLKLMAGNKTMESRTTNPSISDDADTAELNRKDKKYVIDNNE